MQYTINFDMKGQFGLEKDLNSKEKHIIILFSNPIKGFKQRKMMMKNIKSTNF